MKKKNPKSKRLTNDDLITYGCYTKCIESLQHFDTLSCISEDAVSNSNWYAVSAAFFLFSLPIHSKYVLLFCILIGIFDVIYITSRYFSSLVKIERFTISIFYNLINEEKKHDWLPGIFHFMLKKEENASVKTKKNKKNFNHHGSPYRKAIFYISNLSVPFLLLIYTPLYVYINDAISSEILHLFGTTSVLLKVTLYVVFCFILFIIYIALLLRIIGPFTKWMSKIENKGSR
jgi:hypothetical protein